MRRHAGGRVGAGLDKAPSHRSTQGGPGRRYFRALLSAPEQARLVKLADRLDNLRFLHLRHDPDQCRAYREETRQWLLPLAERTDTWFARQLAAFVDQVLMPWEVLGSRVLLKAPPWLSVHAEQVQVNPAALPVDPFYRITMPEYVVIVPRLPDGRFLVLRGYKHGPRRIVYHVPAGYVEPGETPIAAARRELIGGNRTHGHPMAPFGPLRGGRQPGSGIRPPVLGPRRGAGPHFSCQRRPGTA
ncbi:MAG: NUDIX domain-containing protein [Ardenticatenia bacterium]|nr:NUDIX domain-containing protein [Ardenticatenia bacterium]